jgi:hypothetical protein
MSVGAHAQRLREMAVEAAEKEQRRVNELEHDDTIPTSEWDAKPAGFGRIVPTQRVNGSES